MHGGWFELVEFWFYSFDSYLIWDVDHGIHSSSRCDFTFVVLLTYYKFNVFNLFNVHCFGAANVIQFALVKSDDLIQTLGNLVIYSSIKRLYGYCLGRYK